MAEWMLEVETYPWYDFVGATALFIASAYARVEVCRWLLDNGADPHAEMKFPGISIFSSLKTLNAADVIGQSLRAPRPEAMVSIEALLSDSKRLLKAPPAPRFVVKSTWHTWTDMVPYALSRYHVDDVVRCKYKGAGSEKYTAIVKKVNVKESRDAVQTYKLLYEPPDGGYYKPALKKATRKGELDTEVLYVFKDGKDPVPLYEDDVPEESLTLADGSIPEAQKKFRRVCFTQLRAKISLNWETYWIPSKAYCKELKHQLRYRLVGNLEWINISLDVPRHILKGLFLERAYEFQVRTRNNNGWSDHSMPTLVIETPKRRKSERSKYPELEAFGYVGRNNRLGAEIATDEDWAWWEEKQQKGGKEGGSGSGKAK